MKINKQKNKMVLQNVMIDFNIQKHKLLLFLFLFLFFFSLGGGLLVRVIYFLP